MDFFNEFGLAIAVALPVLVIVGMNAFLAFTGESSTLLLPGMSSFPEIKLNSAPAVQSQVAYSNPSIVAAAEPANDMVEREAA